MVGAVAVGRAISDAGWSDETLSSHSKLQDHLGDEEHLQA